MAGHVPQVTGCAFLSSYDVLALQAADLIAWEVYQHANEIFAAGAIQPAKRWQLREHLNPAIFRTQYANREAIQKIADYIMAEPEEYRKAAADHFTNFDPGNPDYSYLSGKRSS